MATIPTAAALDLMYRSSTTGAPTAEFDRLGGYAAVKAAAEAAGYSATPEFIQSYEVANNLPNSAAAQSQGQQAPTQDELAQMMRDSNNQRLNEVAQAQQQAAAAQAQQQAAAQQAAAQQAAVQAVQRAAQARSTGLLDVAPRAAATAGPAINRPTAMMQPSYAQVAPAQITNRAITGTPYSSIYSPATMRQNAPTLASVQAAAKSSNPYAALMALSQQQSMPGSYAGPAGATTANPYLGGYNPSIYNPATTTGPLTTPSAGIYSSGAGVGPGGAEGGIKGGGQTGYGSLANLAGEAQRAGFTTIGNFLGGLVPVDAAYNKVDLDTGKTVKGAFTQADIDALSGKNDPGSSVALSGSRQDFRAQELAAQNLAERNAFTASMVNGLLGQSNMYAQQADALPGPTTNAQPQGYDTAGSRAAAAALANAAANLAAAESAAPGGVNGGYGGYGGVTGGSDTMGFGGEYAKGGKVNMKPQMHNPPGPDDGYAALENGEYVIRKSAVKKYGSNIFEQINAGRIPAQRLKSLLE